MARVRANASSSRVERNRRWRHVVTVVLVLLGCGFAVSFIKEVADRARLVAPRPTPIVYDRQGVFITQIGDKISDASGQRIDYGYWPLKQLPDRVTRATLALEDRRFWDHPGVDPAAILRAAFNDMRGQKRSGASTLAMQIARMQHPASRSFLAKAYEAATAIALTLRFGHEAILAQYLRLVPYGNGSHGIAHAARFYFDKPVEDLSWAEIALLSAIPQSPTRMNPLHPDGLSRAVRRGQGMLDELARQGVIGAAELALAHRQLASIGTLQAPRRPAALHVVLRYEALAAGGHLPVASQFDPRVRASVDLDIQKQTTKLARRYLDSWRNSGAQQVAVMIVERGSEAVLADVGSVDYRDQHAGAIDFSRALRSPGSTLKPFIYALALDRGVIRPSDVLPDLPEGSSLINNADGHFLGPMLPRQALANSRNVPATNLLRMTGLDTTFSFLRRLGLHNFEVPADSFGLSMAIGSLPTTLEKLVKAYGSIAEDGRLADLQWVEGQKRHDPERVMSTDAARLITSFLSDPMARLPSFPRYGPTEYPFPVALKTGTSQGYRDAWTVAWSRQYLVGVWIGRGDDGTMNQLSGADTAGRLVHALLVQLHGSRRGDLDDTTFPPPAGRSPIELCVFGGLRSNGNCGQTLTEWLRPDEIPPVDQTLSAIATSPARVVLKIAAADRAWATAAGYLVADRGSVGESTNLSIVAPENNSRIWLNPDAPAAVANIALKVVVEPKVPQVVWYVDGVPFATVDPDKTIYWPIAKGAHRFQARLPLQPGVSNIIHVVVE